MDNIVRIDPTVELPPSEPGEYCVTPFRGAENKFYAGIWSADPHSLDFESYEVDEVCVVLSGKITLTEVGHKPQVFVAGDAFGLKKGTALNWTQEAGTRKIFVILDN
jgi:uncharacterized cupin superfamily protein